jgi:hypothetical protein
MAIYPQILVGAAAARVVIADRFPHERVDVRGDTPPRRASHSPLDMIAETGSDQWRVICTALPEGINVLAGGQYGFSISSWGGPRIPGTVLVDYPRSPLTEDQDGFRAELATVLLPVVESALAAIQSERDAQMQGGRRG